MENNNKTTDKGLTNQSSRLQKVRRLISGVISYEMKNRQAESKLQSLMNIGPATVRRLHAIGIKTPSQLIKSNPDDPTPLYVPLVS